METVFLGEVEIPHAHIFTEGRTLVRDCVVNQICLRSMLRVRWEMKLRGAATRPGEHPITIPLPETVFVSRRLSRYLLGPGKTSTMVRLLRYSSGLASPVPSGVPRLIDAGWTRLGGRTRGRATAPTLRRSPSDSDQDAAVHVPSREGTGAVYEALIP